eukprot:UN01986
MEKTDQEGWSDARKIAFSLIETSPNAYYYRFNTPGEKAASGPWSNEEITIFMKQLADFGANNRWGDFSKAIPGRVGYTCAQKYRKLLQKGAIFDINHVWCGDKFSTIKKSWCKNSSEDFDHNNKYGFVVLHDETGVFDKLPACHEKATKAFKDKFLKHKTIVEAAEDLKNEPIIMPKNVYTWVIDFPAGAYGSTGPSKKIKIKKPKKEYPKAEFTRWSNGKWISSFIFGEVTYDIGEFDKELSAVVALDQAKLEVFGSKTKTYFPKDNYDLKASSEKYRELKIKIGVANALSQASELKTVIADKNIFSSKKIAKLAEGEYKVCITVNGLEECIGTSKTDKDGEILINDWLKNSGQKIIDDYTKLRKMSITAFEKTGNEVSYRTMMFAHGDFNVSDLFQNEKMVDACKAKLPNFG